MIRHAFFSALRSLRRSRRYTALNLAGLALGLGAALLVFTFVSHELSYDRFHTDADRIGRLTTEIANADNPEWPSIHVAAADAAATELPEIDVLTRVDAPRRKLLATDAASRYEERLLSVEPSFFDVFDFRVLEGSALALDQPNTLLLTPETARFYFGDADAVGQTIQVDDQAFTVAGLVEAPPLASHLRFDGLTARVAPPADRAWSRLAFTYVRLADGATWDALEAKLPAFSSATFTGSARPINAELRLQPLLDIHLSGRFASDIQPQGDMRYVWLFSFVGLILLLLAVINYVNLAIARSVERAREVGVRKTLGARPSELVLRFLGESVGLTLVAAAVGVALAALALPAFSSVMQREMVLPLGPAGIGLIVLGAVPSASWQAYTRRC